MRSPLQVRQHIGCTVSSSQAKPRLLCTLPSCCQANKLSVSKRNSHVSSGTDPVKVSYTVRSFQVNKQALLPFFVVTWPPNLISSDTLKGIFGPDSMECIPTLA